ncbi:hypothetical protein [Nocardia salmonicida]|uniref:hypothetical protein n=1 Tax=Nocardia salmonicida TaxID=53431 RepID=UPI0034063DEF
MLNRLPLWPTATAFTVVLIALTAWLSVGRDDGEPVTDPHRPTYTHIEGPTPDGADASTAVEMGLTAMFSWQPRTDSGPGAALTRAAPWLSGDLASAATGAPATGRVPHEWSGWRDSNDIVTALVDAEAPRTIGTETAVEATVIQQVLHRDGSTTFHRRMHVTVTVTEAVQGWQMSSYRIDSVASHG